MRAILSITGFRALILGAISFAQTATAQIFQPGDPVEVSYFYSGSNPPGPPAVDQDNVAVVGPGVFEVPDFAFNSAAFDFSTDRLLIQFLVTGSWDPMAFNGPRITDYTGTLPSITGVSIDPGSFFPGFTAAQIAFDGDNIFLNWAGLAVDPTMVLILSINSGSEGTNGGDASGSRKSRRATPSERVTDIGAIHSLLTTGLLMPIVQRQAVQYAASGTIRDLNSRLFRARSGLSGDFKGDGKVDGSDTLVWLNNDGIAGGPRDANGDGVVDGADLSILRSQFASTMDTSIIRYLNFAAAQNMDYRVALGLRDGVEVEYRDDTMVLGDTFWATSPFALSGGPALVSAAPAFTKAVVAAPLGASTGGKEILEDKVVIVEPAFKRFEVFSEFDYGFYDQDCLTNLVRGFDSDTYAGSAGMEYRLFPWLHVGGAFTYLENQTDVSSNRGSVDLDGTLFSGYFTAFWKQFYLDTLYSYGNFDNEISRNTMLGSNARGDTDSYAHNIDINLGFNHRLTDQILTGPFLGLNYATGGIGGYTERNGGNANVVYPDDNYESMIGRLGWQLSYTTDTAVGRVTAQGRAGWGREFMPEADTVRAGLANSPFILVSGNRARRVGGFAAAAESAHAGTDWLELGAGLRLDFHENWNVQLDYEGQFARNSASAHFAALKVEYEWDNVFRPRPGGGGKGVVAETVEESAPAASPGTAD